MTAALACRHHWLLEADQPGQQMTPARCRDCGETRAFDHHQGDYSHGEISRASWREAVALRKQAKAAG